MLERFLLMFLNIALSLAVGWIGFGAVYWAISEIQIARFRARCRKRHQSFLAKNMRLRDNIWEYVFYGPVMPIMHHERKKQKSNLLHHRLFEEE